MKKLLIIIVILLGVVLISKNSYAVYLGSPGNEISHMEQIANQVDQYVRQGMQYITQGEQLAAETKMLATNPAGVAKSAAMSIQSVSQLAGQIQQLESQAEQSISDFQALQGSTNPSQIEQNIQAMEDNLNSETQAQMQNYGVQAATSGDLQENLQQDLTNLQNAQGQTAALQASGSIAGIEVQQLQQLNTNLNAEHTLELQQIQKQQGEENQQNSETKYLVPPPPPSNLNLYGGN
jgi:P-type conjugative transfer protein TrbJ